MRSEQELDAEVRRLRRSMRRLLGGLTLALVVGVAVIVAVVGASLTTADKQALQAFTGGAHKPDAPKAEATKAAKADPAKDARQPPAPIRETTGQGPAAPQSPPPTATAAAPPPPAPVSTVATAPPPAAPAAAQPPAPAATAASRQEPVAATTTGAAAPQAPAAVEPRRAAEPKKPQQRQKQIARTRPADDTERDASATTGDRPHDTSVDRAREQTQPPADTAARDRASHGRYVRTRPADQDRGRVPDDASGRDRVVIIDRGPGGYAPREAGADDQPHEARRDNGPFGLFGALFGQRPDRDGE
jgi:hypothetical protein